MKHAECEVCGTCRFFLVAEEQRSDDSLIGQCRANPPVGNAAMLVTGAVSARGVGTYDVKFRETPKPGVAMFPLVLSRMWCGLCEGS